MGLQKLFCHPPPFLRHLHGLPESQNFSQKTETSPMSSFMDDEQPGFFWDSEHADAEGDGSRKMFAGRQQGSKIDKRIENRAFETILFSNVDSIGLL